MAGVDEALLKPRSIADKIAALLPFPAVRAGPGAAPPAVALRLASRAAPTI